VVCVRPLSRECAQCPSDNVKTRIVFGIQENSVDSKVVCIFCGGGCISTVLFLSFINFFPFNSGNEFIKQVSICDFRVIFVE
jgi:hypothetical protein